MNIEEIIRSALQHNKFIYGVFTTPVNKSESPYKKITVRPVRLKGESAMQLEKFTDTKVFHENLSYADVYEIILKLIKKEYRNINLFTEDADFQIMVSKKGSIRITEKSPEKKVKTEEHNKKKQYIIPENEPCEFLQLLGVMNEQGQVYAKRYDKFKQINKFLEIVDDSLNEKSTEGVFKVIDFGCGKAYLTFALYHYFYNIRKVKAQITGLDLKEDVIRFCNDTAKALKYDGLEFQRGDIADFQCKDPADMVVTLHACDNATDAALVKAIKWDTGVILSVPCCQHEFFDKIENPRLEPMLKHGLVKERLSSLVTDSLRSLFLEKHGYRVQLLEFISMEHTPKNILIRAVKTGRNTDEAYASYMDFKKFWNLEEIFIENYYDSQE